MWSREVTVCLLWINRANWSGGTEIQIRNEQLVQEAVQEEGASIAGIERETSA